MLKPISQLFRFLPGLTWGLLQACAGAGPATDAELDALEQAAKGDPDCPVPAICQLCDDGTCATPNVEIVDGECGQVTYSCDNTPGANTSNHATSSPPSNAPDCPVPAICQLCDDGSCATPNVEVVNGECGPISYSCEGAGKPVSNEPSGAQVPCAVPAICQLCDDGSCATPEVSYNDGKCGAVHFVCPVSVDGSRGPDAGVDGGGRSTASDAGSAQ